MNLEATRKMDLFTVFEIEHNRFLGRDANGNSIVEWIKELNFYKGDLSGIDVKNDWRTKEVSKKRRNAIMFNFKYCK